MAIILTANDDIKRLHHYPERAGVIIGENLHDITKSNTALSGGIAP